SVLENGPWLIRMVPMILNVWSSNTDLKKAEVKKALVWVKLHHVPIVAYSELLGKSTYARVLIEVSVEVDLMDSLVIAIHVGYDKGYSLATIDIEYEWRPPRCSTCLIFDHMNDKCPKLPKEVSNKSVEKPDENEGFVEVKRKKHKAKTQVHKQIEGVWLSKVPPKFQYRRVEKAESSKVAEKQANVLQTQMS
ncbi:zinc knuckle CX2CX4HX4C containing protein, partial [Tanacetum coccineum]